MLDRNIKKSVLLALLVILFPFKSSVATERQLISGFGFATPSLLMENRGNFVAYIGWAYRNHWRTPLFDLEGHYHRFCSVGLDLYFSKFSYLRIRGDIQQLLWYERNQTPPDLKTSGNPLYDVGDFSIGTVFLFFEQTPSWRSGIQIESVLPNTNQNKGLGCNSLKINVSCLTEWSLKSAVLTVLGGVGIWESPKKTNWQNDVLLYGMRFTVQLRRNWYVGTGIQGHLSFANTVPLGTEDRGFYNLGILWRGRRIEFHLLSEYGLNRREGTWGISTGIGFHHSL